eukprot:scaffold30993_cov50-Cyclotella_meneghiniana.AAC.3
MVKTRRTDFGPSDPSPSPSPVPPNPPPLRVPSPADEVADEDNSDGESKQSAAAAAASSSSSSVACAAANEMDQLPHDLIHRVNNSDDAPLPAAQIVDVKDPDMIEKKKTQIELMPSDPAPLPPAQVRKDPDMIERKETQIELMPSDPAPLPAAQAVVEDNVTDVEDMKKLHDPTRGINSADVELIPPDPSPLPAMFHHDTMCGKVGAPVNRNSRPSIIGNSINAMAGDLIENVPRNVDAVQYTMGQDEYSGGDRGDETPQTLVGDAPRLVANISRRPSLTSSTSQILNASVSVIPQAFLVEDDDHKEVTPAELVLPWWKQKRFYVALAILVLIGAGVAAGTVHYVRNNKEKVIVLANATTTTPSISLAPSSSLMPSFQPSACAERSSMNAERLEYNFLNETQQLTAMDGGRAVVADIHLQDGTALMHVVFYELTPYGWMKTEKFEEFMSYWAETYSLAMSKDTVLVGTPFVLNETGDVLVYEYNHQLKEWKRNWEAMLFESNGNSQRVGQSLDIDDDLAVINAPGEDEVFIYHRENGDWSKMTSFEMPNTTSIALSGDTIALTVGCQLHLYLYDRNANSVEKLQHFVEDFCTPNIYGLGIGSIAISESHLAVSAFLGNFRFDSSDNGCWNPYLSLRATSKYPLYDVALYHRFDETMNYEFLQMLNSYEFEAEFGPNLDLDEDFLLVGGVGNITTTFTFSEGVWEESVEFITPNQCGIDGYDDTVVISKRNAMVSTYDDGVYVFNIDDCAPMPTSVPSDSPTSDPTITCFQVELTVEHYHALEPTWLFEQMNETIDELFDDTTSIPTFRPTFEVTFSVGGYFPLRLTYANDRKCLKEGTYTFTIYKDPLLYNLTSYGNVIADGIQPGWKESTTFQIPFQ